MLRPNITLLLTCNGHFGDQNLGSPSGNCQEDTERGQSQEPTPAGLPQASGCRMGCLTFDLEQAVPQPSISHVADSDPLPQVYAIVQCRIHSLHLSRGLLFCLARDLLLRNVFVFH